MQDRERPRAALDRERARDPKRFSGQQIESVPPGQREPPRPP